jgi:hypothetical protein
MAGGTTKSVTYFVMVEGSRVGVGFEVGGGNGSNVALDWDEQEVAREASVTVPTPAITAPKPAPATPIDLRKSRRVTPWLSFDILNLP